MAAPPVTARTEPPGGRIPKGYRILVAFSLDPDVALWEISLTPPGQDGGDPIDITTQWNDTIRTKVPRALIDITDGSGTFGFNETTQAQLLALLNQEGALTFHLPNGGSWSYWGYLRTFEPTEMTEDESPTATCSFTITNYDPTLLVEALPVYTAPPPPPP